MNRIDRLFAITLLLQAKRRVRAIDLAKKFEVSERTIYRDMMALNESGVPIAAMPGEGYELVEGYYLPPLLFTEQEAAALFLGAHLLTSHATGRLPDEVEKALTKLTVALPKNLREEMKHLTEVIHFIAPNLKFDLNEPRLSAIQKAINEHNVIWVKYHSHSRDEVTEREIEPHRLFYYNNAWFFSGYCRLRKDMRSFRLSRMDDLKIMKEKFTPREIARKMEEQFIVRIRFSEDQARWVRERQHYGYFTETKDKRGIIMHYKLNSILEIKNWLLAWGASAEALEPETLRNEIRLEIEKMRALLT